MIRVQTVDGIWSTARHDDAMERMREGRPIEVLSNAQTRRREWVNPAHVVRIVELVDDEEAAP